MYGDYMDGRDLVEYIFSKDKKERIEYLKREDIRDEFLKVENTYPFIWLVQGLGDELKYFIDDDYLDKIIISDNGVNRINAIMTSENEYAKEVLLNDKVIAFILDDYNKLTVYLSSLDYKIGQKIIDYILKHNVNKFSVLGNLRKENQLKVFNSDYIIKLLKCDFFDSNAFINLDGEVVNKLIKYDKFLKMFINLSAYEMNVLIKYKKFIIPEYLINNKNLIMKFATTEVSVYREYINNLLVNNYEFACNVEEERLDYVSKKLNSVSNDIMDEYKDYKDYGITDIYTNFEYKIAFKLHKFYRNRDYDSVIKELKKLSEKKMLELIVDAFFKDTTYNFLINLKAILNYKEQNKDYKIKNLDFYLKLMNFHFLNTLEKIELFNKYKGVDLATSFYEDYRKARNLSYESINDSLLKLDKNNKVYNKELSKKYNRDVYYLDGEEFYLYIHSSYYGVWMNNKKTISISLISHDNIHHYDEGVDKIIFGFNKLNIENIMHLSNSDSYTTNEYGTDKIQRIYNPRTLMEETVGYNEILYSERNLKDFKPDFIVSFDEITEKQLEVANEMNLPIVVINSKKYVKKSGLEIVSENKYVNHNEKVEYDILNEEDTNIHSK